jgi:hypothetical protein
VSERPAAGLAYARQGEITTKIPPFLDGNAARAVNGGLTVVISRVNEFAKTLIFVSIIQDLPHTCGFYNKPLGEQYADRTT